MIKEKWGSLSTKQQELIQEIASGILDVVGLDKVVKVGETLKKIGDLNASEKNDFKYKLIQEILIMDNVDEDVLNAAVEALKKEITSKNMLRYRGKESELLNEICKKYTFEYYENRTAFRKLMDKILQHCSQNAVEIIDHKELGLATYDGVVAIYDAVSEMRSEVSDQFNKMVTTPASSTEPKEVPLKHNNPTYEYKFTAPFFLEEEMPEDEGICSLHNVFVEPVLTRNPALTLEKKLEGWSAEYDRTSGKRSDAMYSVFLLYGKAGVGKSSYTAKIISKKLFGKNWLALELRSCADRLKSGGAWESIKAIFGEKKDAAYKDSILILDGLDEVCVLHPDFNGRDFIENLQNVTALKAMNIKILITSREKYFGDITQKNNLLTDTIQWTEAQVGEWCEAYCTVHKSRSAWAEKFIADYHKLPGGDERRAIFCIPIILYLCCVREIDIGNESTVVEIYEKAFRTVGKHGHNPTTDTEMQEDDECTFAVNWQYTKELAYRIFLNGISSTVLEDNGIQDARKHTMKRMGECAPALDRYFALFPFASKKREEGKPEGMEFAHKTVTDYFTAIKLYEDYFEKIFDEANPVKALWQGLWRAFRYKAMPLDIMEYLAQVIKNRQGVNYFTYRMIFFDYYYEGVKKQTIWKLLDEPKYACKMAYDQLPQQVGLVFRNLTYLLWYLDYEDFEKDPEKAYTVGVSTFFQRGIQMNVQCSDWKGLRDAYLSDAYLSGAYLSGAHLSGAHLSGAHLSGADLIVADLSGAYLRGAHLIVADLRGADLRGADLSGVIWSDNQKLHNIFLWDTDLPQLDEAIEKYGIQLIDPFVHRKETGELLKYNPETNRAEEPLSD